MSSRVLATRGACVEGRRGEEEGQGRKRGGGERCRAALHVMARPDDSKWGSELVEAEAEAEAGRWTGTGGIARAREL